jgi:pimeloyl-ACP methyl ester carboxylesterase
LLRYVASHGFFIVAANSREVGQNSPMTHALDFAAAANQDPSSPYYGHLDMSKVGVMGHSQGGAATVAAANDARVQSAIIFNGGASASKPFLAISGDLDITGIAPTEAEVQQAVNAAPKAAYLWYRNPAGNTADNLRGHLVLMLTPERVADATANWWKMILQNDSTAHDFFVGDSCGLCQGADFDYGQHGL